MACKVIWHWARNSSLLGTRGDKCLNSGFVYDSVAVIVSLLTRAVQSLKAWHGPAHLFCSGALAPKALHCVMEQTSSSSVTTQPGCSWHGAFGRDLPFTPEHRTWLLTYPAPRFPHWGMNTEKWCCRETAQHNSLVPLHSSLPKHNFSVFIMWDSKPISAFPVI